MILSLLVVVVALTTYTVPADASVREARAEHELELDEDVVMRRGGLEPLRGQIILIDEAGVTIRGNRGLGASHLVTWDRVHDVCMARPDPTLQERLAIAERLWRARSRLERGDAALAEPIFEEIFDRYRGQTNETALIVAEGLLRCRLTRLANDLAVLPALEVARLRRAGVTTDRYRMMPTVYDDRFDLCPALPPTWTDSHRLARLEGDLERYDARGDEVVAAFAALYQQALRLMHDVDGEPGRIFDEIRPVRQHPGVQFMRDLVTLIDPAAEGADRRRAAEVRLARLHDADQPWVEAWKRYFTGLSLIRAEGDGRNERGVATLAHLPVHFTQSQPYLAGLAMDHIIRYLEDRGRSESASSMREELVRHFPHHPAVIDRR